MKGGEGRGGLCEGKEKGLRGSIQGKGGKGSVEGRDVCLYMAKGRRLKQVIPGWRAVSVYVCQLVHLIPTNDTFLILLVS